MAGKSVPTLPVAIFDYPVVVVPCHGGAGATTLARLTGNTFDVGRNLPPAILPGQRLLLVARGTVFGARLATEATGYFRNVQGVVPSAVAVVGDGPWPEPRQARVRFRLLPVKHVVRVPYVPAWRWLDDITDKPIPDNIVSAIKNLKKAIDAPR